MLYQEQGKLGSKLHFSKLMIMTQKLKYVLAVSFNIVFAMLGMLSPASRGSLMTAIIFLYVFMG